MVSNRFTNSNDPEHVRSRIFIGNLDCDKISSEELERIYSKFGNVIGISMHKTFAFIQFDSESSAKSAASATNQTLLSGKKVDVNVASERRKPGAGNRPSSMNPDGDPSHYSTGSGSHPLRMRGPSRFSDGFSPNQQGPGQRGPFYQNGPNRGSPYYPPNYGNSHPPHHNGNFMGGSDGHNRQMVPSNMPTRPHDTWQQSGYPHHPNVPPSSNPAIPPQRGGPFQPYDYPEPSSSGSMNPSSDREPTYPPSQYSAPSRPPVRCPIDCEIISTNNKFNHYADYINSQLVARGMNCNTNIQYNQTLIPVLKNRSMATGVPFCILLENANDTIPSVTLCLYFASPEEHRNMTIEAALQLLYTQATRNGICGVSQTPVSNTPNYATNGSLLPSNSATFPAAASMAGHPSGMNHQLSKYPPQSGGGGVGSDNRDSRQAPPPSHSYGGNSILR